MAARTSAPDAHLHRPRTEPELREALSAFCAAAWNRNVPAPPIFSIPPQPHDKDMVLSDGIDELVALRAEMARLRAGLESLRIEHAIGREEGCVGACNCGAEEHNARIDALLTGG